MTPYTVSTEFPKAVPIVCKRNDRLNDLNIQGKCYALLILMEGSATFRIGAENVEAQAPCFVCFDEQESPMLVRKKALKCHSVYFAPTFINVNMTFDRIQGTDHTELADRHDMYLLRPFTDRSIYVFSLFEVGIEQVKRIYNNTEHYLTNQTDWYWSCRVRSYFMELLFILERAYQCMGKQDSNHANETLQSSRLKKAILYIESNYQNDVTLADITAGALLDRTTLTRLFKEELNITPIAYLWQHRIKVAKKQLEFTNLPLKEIASRCGFKTLQHFCRKFEQETGYRPTDFRNMRINKRVDELG